MAIPCHDQQLHNFKLRNTVWIVSRFVEVKMCRGVPTEWFLVLETRNSCPQRVLGRKITESW